MHATQIGDLLREGQMTPQRPSGCRAQGESSSTQLGEIAGNRLRFTIFHEIVHYLLDDDGALLQLLHDVFGADQDSIDRFKEYACHVGAAEFLVSRDEVVKLIHRRGFTVDLISFMYEQYGISRVRRVDTARTECAGSVLRSRMQIPSEVDCGWNSGGSYLSNRRHRLARLNS